MVNQKPLLTCNGKKLKKTWKITIRRMGSSTWRCCLHVQNIISPVRWRSSLTLHISLPCYNLYCCYYYYYFISVLSLLLSFNYHYYYHSIIIIIIIIQSQSISVILFINSLRSLIIVSTKAIVKLCDEGTTTLWDNIIMLTQSL